LYTKSDLDFENKKHFFKVENGHMILDTVLDKMDVHDEL